MKSQVFQETSLRQGSGIWSFRGDTNNYGFPLVMIRRKALTSNASTRTMTKSVGRTSKYCGNLNSLLTEEEGGRDPGPELRGLGRGERNEWECKFYPEVEAA